MPDVLQPDRDALLLEAVDDVIDWLGYSIACDSALWADIQRLKSARMQQMIAHERKRRAALLKAKDGQTMES